MQLYLDFLRSIVIIFLKLNFGFLHSGQHASCWLGSSGLGSGNTMATDHNEKLRLQNKKKTKKWYDVKKNTANFFEKNKKIMQKKKFTHKF
jgi:hypothetical protein